MTLNEYQQQALRTTGELQPFQMIVNGCMGLNGDLDLVAERNIAKLEKRYPEGFDPERSRNREEDAF